MSPVCQVSFKMLGVFCFEVRFADFGGPAQAVPLLQDLSHRVFPQPVKPSFVLQLLLARRKPGPCYKAPIKLFSAACKARRFLWTLTARLKAMPFQIRFCLWQPNPNAIALEPQALPGPKRAPCYPQTKRSSHAIAHCQRTVACTGRQALVAVPRSLYLPAPAPARTAHPHAT